jgi:diaminopimelate epimerase
MREGVSFMFLRPLETGGLPFSGTIMKREISFTKASGAGNDFVLINNMRGELRVDFSAMARAVCDRHFGIGGDGLLVAEPATRADFRMLYFNADGSFGGMCGNGGRCLARFARDQGFAGSHQRFEALGHVYDAVVQETSVRLHMKDPGGYQAHLALGLAEFPVDSFFVNTGSPHVVLPVSDIEHADVLGIGRTVREHHLFSPEGTNTNFMKRAGAGTVELRTYERGVEDETLACGTGSVAAALVASTLYGLGSPIHVTVRSGETLTVHFAGSTGAWSDVYLEGSARMLFSGVFSYETDPPRISRAV